MGYQVLDPSDLLTAVAGADLSTHQYKFVGFPDTNGRVFLAATAGARVHGVLQDKPSAQGQACLVAGSGITKVVAEGPISIGSMVVASTAGLAITSSTTAHHRVGVALEAAAALNDVIALRLLPLGPQVP